MKRLLLIGLLLAGARGGHHIKWMAGVIEIINLQPRGQKAKPYQVRQVRKILLKYGLGANDD